MFPIKTLPTLFHETINNDWDEGGGMKNQQIENFFNKDFLSDCVIVDPFIDKSYKTHMIILAGRSEFFEKYFKKYYDELNRDLLKNPWKIKLPKPIQVKSQRYQSDYFEKSILHLYNECTIENLKKIGMNKENCIFFYSFYHCMKYTKAISLIENFILKEVLQINNVVGILIDFLKFENKKIIEECLEIIDKNFEEIMKIKDNYLKIRDLPFNIFQKIIISDFLNIEKEDILLQIIVDYINIREKEEFNVSPSKIIEKTEKNNSESESPSPLKEESKEKSPEKSEITKLTNNEPLKDTLKISEPIIDKEKNEIDPKEGVLIGEIEDLDIKAELLFKKYRLITEEKNILLCCCRLGFVEHDFLMKISNMTIFTELKHILMEGVSAKLLNYEGADHNYSINLNPRLSYREKIENNQYFKNNKSPNQEIQKFEKNNIIEKNLGSPIKSDIQNKISQIVTPKKDQPFFKDNNLLRNYVSNTYQNYQKQQNFQNSDKNFFEKEKQPNQDKAYQDYLKMQEEIIQKEKFQTIKSQSTNQNKIREPSSDYEEIQRRKQAQSLSPIEFIYKFDFDDNGVIYYLGTLGKSKHWINPYFLNQIDIFFSSLSSGSKVEDFISRECVNCSTKNEKNAYMAIDLGESRYLFPKCYTIRNRPSKKYVMVNWNLEGSINGIEWYVLDKRIHQTDDINFNLLMEKEREELKIKGQTSTWGIDSDNVEKILNEIVSKKRDGCRGFRFFRILQLMKNSDNEFNLCLSGFEIYGIGIGMKWVF